jgi:hypothetical protein
MTAYSQRSDLLRSLTYFFEALLEANLRLMAWLGGAMSISAKSIRELRRPCMAAEAQALA